MFHFVTNYILWATIHSLQNNDTKLDRDLTEAEISEFNDLVKDFDAGWEIQVYELEEGSRNNPDGTHAYFLEIYDEDEMKAYQWKDELKQILDLFTSFGVMVNGSISWNGEKSGNIGTCAIIDNEASLANFASVQNIVALLVDAGLDQAAKLVEYHYCEKL